MTKNDWDQMVEKDKKIYDEIIRDIVGNSKGNISEESAKNFAKKLFDLGFSEGQQYVWFARSGFGETPEVPAGTITVSDSNGKVMKYDGASGKLIEDE